MHFNHRVFKGNQDRQNTTLSIITLSTMLECCHAECHVIWALKIFPLWYVLLFWTSLYWLTSRQYDAIVDFQFFFSKDLKLPSSPKNLFQLSYKMQKLAADPVNFLKKGNKFKDSFCISSNAILNGLRCILEIDTLNSGAFWSKAITELQTFLKFVKNKLEKWGQILTTCIVRNL